MKSFWIHLGAQLATAGVGAIVAAAQGADYSSLGGWAGAAQGIAAVAAELYNLFGGKPAATKAAHS